MTDRAATLQRIFDALGTGDEAEAQKIAEAEYPFEPATNPGRSYTPYQMTRAFMRDDFIDRYSGERLVFPGQLRLLSTLLPEHFPAHPNWKMSESHIVYYELFPTIDHVEPVARGGADEEGNWVTTSMLRNGAKAHWTLEELAWALKPAGRVEEWDGLMGWFLKYTEEHPKVLTAYMRRWRSAAVRVFAEAGDQQRD